MIVGMRASVSTEAKVTLAAALVATALAAQPAGAHVEATEVPAGEPSEIAFVVGHGCGDSPTTSIAVQIPAGVVDIEPRARDGWRIETETGPLPASVELDGQTITNGVQIVRWTDGELDPHTPETFFLAATVVAEVGSSVDFPFVQTCREGELAWIQIPSEEQDPNDLEYPAPGVEVVGGIGRPDTSLTTIPSSSTTTTTVPETTSSTAEVDDPAPTQTTLIPPTTVPAPSPTLAGAAETDESSPFPMIAASVVSAMAAGGTIVWSVRRRRSA